MCKLSFINFKYKITNYFESQKLELLRKHFRKLNSLGKVTLHLYFSKSAQKLLTYCHYRTQYYTV